MHRYRFYMGQAILAMEMELEPGVLGGVPVSPSLNHVLDMHRLMVALLHPQPSRALPVTITSGRFVGTLWCEQTIDPSVVIYLVPDGV